jgi:hypothetical protein
MYIIYDIIKGNHIKKKKKLKKKKKKKKKKNTTVLNKLNYFLSETIKWIFSNSEEILSALYVKWYVSHLSVFLLYNYIMYIFLISQVLF